MKDFWQITFIFLSGITIALVILFWYIIPDPVVRWIMMLSNLAFTLIFIAYAFRFSKRRK